MTCYQNVVLNFSQCQEDLLGSSQAELLVSQLHDVIRQLKEDPTKLPVLEPPPSPARKPPSTR
ncbi:unnamed protein product, partial [Nesidiocoris tenuis]